MSAILTVIVQVMLIATTIGTLTWIVRDMWNGEYYDD